VSVPAAMASRKPFSMEGTNTLGMSVPTSLLTNSSLALSPLSAAGIGSTRPVTLPNCPDPPLCFLCVYSNDAGALIVSR
jgi:hypothetical protein